MATSWWELRLVVNDQWADDLAGLLVADGALGVELRAGDAAQRVELVVAYPGTVALEEVRANAVAAIESLGLAPASYELRVEQRADAAWATSWKEHFHPLRLGRRVWIVPSWETDFVAPEGACVLTLDPGMAFGTGQHATTALCLEWLEQELDARPGARVLDVGCGSGILAIAACKLGAAAVTAIDNDPEAVVVCGENATANGLALASSATPLHEVAEPADLVVANILAETLIGLAGELVRHTGVGGRLAVSGVLAEQGEAVREALLAAAATRAWRCLEERRTGEWLLLVFGRAPAPHA